MGRATVASMLGRLNPSRLTGPIFIKELRVSSRRFRNYLTRLLYLALLTFFAALAWNQAMRSVRHLDAGTAMYSMPQVGQAIVVTIAWFQFIVLQLVAVVAASTSISDEIYHQTIHSLLTTPITSLQIVLGKLASRLVHLVLLLTATLPLLAVIRVFGGVPWEFVLASTCVTLTACLFAGTVSLFYSVLFRRAYVVILLTLGTGLVLYLLLPLAIALMLYSAGAGPDSPEIFAYSNPPMAMSAATYDLLWGGHRYGRGLSFIWWVHCLIMLGASLGLLVPCVALVRRVCRRAGTGEDRAHEPAPQVAPLVVPPAAPVRDGEAQTPAMPAAPAPPAEAELARLGVRRVSNSPVLWRELHGRLVQGGWGTRILLIVFVALLGLLYVSITFAESRAFSQAELQVAFIEGYVLIGLVAVGVLAATGISSEKESRSLPILLCTPLESWQIVWAKAVGVIRRSMIGWSFLMVHTALFVLGGVLHPILLVFLFLMIGGYTFFLTGTGLYFSATFKKTTTAVIFNLLVGVTIWGVVPLTSMLMEVDHLPEAINVTNPFIEAGILTVGSGGPSHEGRYRGFENCRYDWSLSYWNAPKIPADGTLARVVVCGGGYAVVAVGLLLAAAGRLRRNLF